MKAATRREDVHIRFELRPGKEDLTDTNLMRYSKKLSRWAKSGSLDRSLEQLQQAQVVQIKSEAVSLDSTSIKVHSDGTGARKNGPQAIGKSRGGWTTKIHLIAADARTAVTFSLSPSQAHDAVEGRALLERLGPPNRP